MSPRNAATLRVLALALALGPVPAAARPTAPAPPVADPFAAGLRWSHAPAAAAPWIPRDVAFAARGEWVWAAPAVANPHLVLLGTSDGSPAGPLMSDAGPTGSIGAARLCAGDEPGELFSALQFPEAAGRRTEVSRHDPVKTAQAGAAFAPVWTYDPGVASEAPARVACDASASALVLAVHDGAGAVVDWLDPELGLRTARAFAPGSTLAALEVSAGAQRVALACGREVRVLAADGTVLLHETLAAAPRALALSADGATLAAGGFGTVAVWTDTGGGFVSAPAVVGAASELPAVLDLCASGERLAVGWWDFTTGTSARLEVFDLSGGVRLVERAQPGSPGGVQNLPTSARLSADGRRAAFGLWGAGDARPEVLLIDVGTDADLLALDLPGSVEDVALDPSGTRVAVARKDAHANAFSSTGAVELYDTGERDLQALSMPALGGALDLRARRPGATHAIFALGTPLPGPAAGLELPPFGTLFLDPDQPLHLFGAAADADGIAGLQLAIPPLPELLGAEAAVQVLFLGTSPDALSATALRPVVL